VIALHARHSAIVISAEDAVIVGIAALLKPWISQTRSALTTIEIRRFASESAAGARESAGHLPIGIRYAEPMFRVMHPLRPAEFSVEFTETVAVKEGIIDE
jgi:hypothetical protein